VVLELLSLLVPAILGDGNLNAVLVLDFTHLPAIFVNETVELILDTLTTFESLI
jgi:hypothetical protein